ncbi:ring canal kelch homolog [Saccostrea echinata]|uniref:ring canal kelch homolog n=1 Tax=Saccostrea echinata TaxID=191078 RepID=UPI002A8309B0|nr:ring canal kelch homolog [Saccostrea echinata]
MATRTGRTPTKVRANREAVAEYFHSLREEPVKEGSALQQTPSGLHFKLPSKRLVYESGNYAVFDVRDGSSNSDESSFHSLREQESIDAPQGFYYGGEHLANTEETCHDSEQQHASRSAQREYSQRQRSSSERRATSSTRGSAFTAQQDAHLSRMSSQYYDAESRHKRSMSNDADYYNANERLSHGNIGREPQPESSRKGGVKDEQYTSKSTPQQGTYYNSQYERHYRGQQSIKEGMSSVAGTSQGQVFAGVSDNEVVRKQRQSESSYEDEMLMKGLEQVMNEAVSSTKEMNQFLYDLWRSQRMCDIIIKVNDKEFHAHKLALAAHSEKFTSRYCEEAPLTISEVILPHASAEAAETLINYIYTNELVLTAENIESIIICARQLGIKSALNFCQDFLNSFTRDSVLFLLPIAQRQGFTEVAERMFGFINKCSLTMMQSEGFLQCEMHQVEWLISQDQLAITTELEVFFAVLRWIDHDQKERIKYAPVLVGCVRLIYISPDDLVKHVEPERHIFSIQKCFEMLYFAFRYHAIKLGGSTLYTIMKVPPPRQYTIPVSEQSQTCRRISNIEKASVNQTNNTSSCGSVFLNTELQSNGGTSQNFTYKDTTAISPHKRGASESTGYTPNLKEETVRHGSHNGSGNKSFEYAENVKRGYQSDKTQDTKQRKQSNNKVDSTGQSSGSESKKSLDSAESFPSRDTEEQFSLGRGKMADAKPVDSEPSASERTPNPRGIVNKLSPATQKVEEKKKIAAPKVRTRDKIRSRDRFLVIGGVDPFEMTDNETSRLVEEFYPSKSEWTSKSSLPDARHHTCACLLDGFIYLIGGSTYDQQKPENLANPTSTCFRYDPDKDYWSRISSLQTPRMYHGAGVLSGVIYAVGGHDYTGRPLDTVEYYNADTDSWNYAANMTEPKLGVACTGYKGRLVVIGGAVDRGGQKVVLTTVECYDPKLNCWVRKKCLPKPLCHAYVLEVNNDLYLLGGATQETPGGIVLSSGTVYRYTNLCEVWVEFTQMITPRHDASAVAIGCNIYIVGGISTATGEAVESMEVLDCETATWEEENEEEFRAVVGVACVRMPRL